MGSLLSLQNVCMLLNMYDKELYMVMVSEYHFHANFFFLYKLLFLFHIS